MALVPNYAPTAWVDHTTPVDQARMLNIEGAIDGQADAINSLDTRVVAQEAQPAIPAVVNGQWIKGVGGAAVWSAIAQSDVTGLTAALTAKQDTSGKGAASGYAGLDSTGKVPSSQLPPYIDLNYAGAYSGATTYKEGDIVIYNGVSYLALRASTGETPAAWSSGPGTVTEQPANQTATGVIVSLVAGEALTLGNPVCLKSDGFAWKAAATSGLYPAFGLALASVAASARLNILLCGIYRDDALYNWTVAGQVYLSATAGAATQAQPSATDNAIQSLGIATHADRLYFNPDLTWVTHT